MIQQPVYSSCRKNYIWYKLSKIRMDFRQSWSSCSNIIFVIPKIFKHVLSM